MLIIIKRFLFWILLINEKGITTDFIFSKIIFMFTNRKFSNLVIAFQLCKMYLTFHSSTSLPYLACFLNRIRRSFDYPLFNWLWGASRYAEIVIANKKSDKLKYFSLRLDVVLMSDSDPAEAMKNESTNITPNLYMKREWTFHYFCGDKNNTKEA